MSIQNKFIERCLEKFADNLTKQMIFPPALTKKQFRKICGEELSDNQLSAIFADPRVPDIKLGGSQKGNEANGTTFLNTYAFMEMMMEVHYSEKQRVEQLLRKIA